MHLSTGTLITTVSASDGDDSASPNGTFTFILVSVTPKTDNVEFYINQNRDIGSIYFKGCLDYEVNIVALLYVVILMLIYVNQIVTQFSYTN